MLTLATTSVVSLSTTRVPESRSFTDAIHRTIELDPLSVQVIDTPEFQRLRGIAQLGHCSWVFPSATHDRFQHSLGVAHLAGAWAEHFQRTQPELQLSDTDVLCVRLAGLLHDLGHGPFSHFWEHDFIPAARPAASSRTYCHEEVSGRMLDRIFETSNIDVSPWLTQRDITFIKELIGSSPPSASSGRLGASGVPGLDKGFLYQIVANPVSGLDVDKLDYFERDSYFAGIVKVSFDARRLMRLARVARAGGRLQICFPEKCASEVLHVFQSRFNLHNELYQHRVAQQVALMLCDALVLAEPHLPVQLPGGRQILLHECGSGSDPSLDGFLQLSDAIVPLLLAEAAKPDAAPDLMRAAELVQRVRRRKLYKYVGSVVLDPQDLDRAWLTRQGQAEIASQIAAIMRGAEGGGAALESKTLRVDMRRVNYGRGDRNPLESVFFFDNKRRQMWRGKRGDAGSGRGDAGSGRGDAGSGRGDASSGDGRGRGDGRDDGREDGGVLEAHLSRRFCDSAAQLPRAFQESSLRLFITAPQPELLEAARSAFQQWCDERDLCEDGEEECVVRGLEPSYE